MRHIPIPCEDVIPGEDESQWNEHPHRECISSPGMGMCLTGNGHSLYRVVLSRENLLFEEPLACKYKKLIIQFTINYSFSSTLDKLSQVTGFLSYWFNKKALRKRRKGQNPHIMSRAVHACHLYYHAVSGLFHELLYS